MNRLLKKRMLIVSISLAFLLLINIGVSYSYYLGKVVGNESDTTLSFKSAGIKIQYENNSGDINVGDIMPGWSATKNFSLSSNILETDFTNDQTKLWYEIILYVDQNDFPTDILTYTLTPSETLVGSGVAAVSRINAGIATGTNAEGISLGLGYFAVGSNKHDYSITFNYVDNGSEYSNYPDNIFSVHIGAKVVISSSIIIDLDGGSIEGSTTKYASKGGTVVLPIPTKEGYIFDGWAIMSGDGNVDGNNVTVNGEMLSISAIWKSKANNSVLLINTDGGIINHETMINIRQGEIYTLEIPTKSGYIFKGWEIERGDADISGNNIVAHSENISIIAIWIENIPIDFSTVGEHSYTVTYTGYYKFEVWGAQGGNSDAIGGYGGYSVGNILLNSSDKIYIYVGGHPTSYEGGFNGGGSADENSAGTGGGGATHISKENGVLSLQTLYAGILNSPILVVAGGGGGACGFSCTAIGGHAGGFVGSKGNGYKSGAYGLGGTQVSGGQNSNSNTDLYGSFGQGGKGSNEGGGGGGYYGGGGTHSDTGGSGGGGSGFIGNPLLIDKYMYCYNCETSDEESTRTYSITCAEETPTKNCAKKGDGYARITYLHP